MLVDIGNYAVNLSVSTCVVPLWSRSYCSYYHSQDDLSRNLYLVVDVAWGSTSVCFPDIMHVKCTPGQCGDV